MMRKENYNCKNIFLFSFIGSCLTISTISGFAFGGFLLFAFFAGTIVSPAVILLAASAFLLAATIAGLCLGLILFSFLKGCFPKKEIVRYKPFLTQQFIIDDDSDEEDYVNYNPPLIIHHK